MIERYAILAERIRQELANSEGVMGLRPVFIQVHNELETFASFLDQLAVE